MKAYPLLVLLVSACLGFSGCATQAPPKPRPFMGILDARKIGNGPPESSQYEVVVHYEDMEPGKYEIKVGFGYTPTEEGMKAFAQASQGGLYAIAHSDVLTIAKGDLRLTIEPSAVREQKGVMDGKVHAILSKYPHGKEWLITKHDVFVLPTSETGIAPK